MFHIRLFNFLSVINGKSKLLKFINKNKSIKFFANTLFLLPKLSFLGLNNS